MIYTWKSVHTPTRHHSEQKPTNPPVDGLQSQHNEQYLLKHQENEQYYQANEYTTLDHQDMHLTNYSKGKINSNTSTALNLHHSLLSITGNWIEIQQTMQ